MRGILDSCEEELRERPSGAATLRFLPKNRTVPSAAVENFPAGMPVPPLVTAAAAAAAPAAGTG